jgi:2'-5' RNA ligase
MLFFYTEHMKQRKIFVGISVSPQIAKRLEQRMDKWRDLPVRFTKKDNFHVTLLFLGYMLDDAVVEVCNRVEEAVRSLEPFDIVLDRIVLAPEQGKHAKMLWLTGEANKDLKTLYEALEKALGLFSAEKKSFRPHVTLGRTRKTRWENLPEPPTIDEPFSVSLSVESVMVFESIFVGGKGLVYEPLGEYFLG